MADEDLWQGHRLLHPRGPEVLRHVQVDDLVAVGVRQPGRAELRRPLEYPVHLQPPGWALSGHGAWLSALGSS